MKRTTAWWALSPTASVKARPARPETDGQGSDGQSIDMYQSEDGYQAWQAAWRWLCRRRRHAPANADIWDVWYHWPRECDRLYRVVTAGKYRLSPLLMLRSGGQGTAVAQWSARDALVLKWVSLLIQGKIPVHACCVHVAGHHGGRTSLQRIAGGLREGMHHIYRTDIRGYYRHIRKKQLYAQVIRYVQEPVLQDLIYQYLHYSVEDGGEIHTPATGICRGCALSPYLGATLLYYVDSYFSRGEGVKYVRYMDDFLFLSDRRWSVRRARHRLHEFFDTGGFDCHPDKTFIGRAQKGFDWLGVWFTDQGATGIAPRALQNHRERRLRLEEQSRRRGLTEEAVALRMQRYEARWQTWADNQLRAARQGSAPGTAM